MADAQQHNDAFEYSYSEEEAVVDTRSELRDTPTACISKEVIMQIWLYLQCMYHSNSVIIQVKSCCQLHQCNLGLNEEATKLDEALPLVVKKSGKSPLDSVEMHG